MSYILQSLTTEPPGGWVFDDPLVPGLPIRADSFEDLLERVVHLRHMNGVRTQGTEYDIIEAIAKSLNTAQKAAFAIPKVRMSRTYKQRLRALRALVHPDYVTLERAEARAKICAKCPKQAVNTNPVTRVEDLAAIKRVHDDERSVPNEDELQNCSVCTCPNAASVHFDVQQAVSGYTEEMWDLTPDECWKKVELQGLLPDSQAAIDALKALKSCSTCRGKR